MSTVHRIAKNTIVMLIAQVLGYVLAFFYMMYAARYLGPEDFGILSFAIAFTTIFAILGDFGLHAFMVREIARDRSLTEQYLVNVCIAKIALAIIAFGLIVLAINITSHNRDTILVVYLLGISSVINSFCLIFMAIYQAHEKMEYIGISQALNSIIIFVGVLVAVYVKLSVIGFAFVYLAAAVVVFLYNLIAIRLIFQPNFNIFTVWKIKYDSNFMKLAYRESLAFGLIALFVGAYSWIDTVLLSAIKGNEVIGWYSAAYRPVITLMFIPSALVGAIYPIMSRYHQSANDSLIITFEKSLKYLCIVGFPICIGTTILADRFILLLYGNEFMPAAQSLQILIWSVIPAFANTVFSTLLYAMNRQSLVTKVYFIVLLANIILNLIFIPVYSYIGTSEIRVVCECTMLVLICILTYRMGYKMSIQSGIVTIFKIVVAGGAMGIITWYLRQGNLGVAVVASIITYLILIIIMKVWDRTDILLLRQLFGIKIVNDNRR